MQVADARQYPTGIPCRIGGGVAYWASGWKTTAGILAESNGPSSSGRVPHFRVWVKFPPGQLSNHVGITGYRMLAVSGQEVGMPMAGCKTRQVPTVLGSERENERRCVQIRLVGDFVFPEE